MKEFIITLSCFSLLVSCNKDEITIEKNESTTWQIDKKVEDNDIRTQLGYDPRLNYIYLRPTVALLVMLPSIEIIQKK